MKKQINEKIKANYMTVFYIALVLLFCLIFKEEFIGETGSKIASGMLGILGYFGYVAIGVLFVLSFTKVVFSFRLFKAKKFSLYALSVLAMVLLTVILDAFVGENFVFGGKMSNLISMPFKTIFGNVGTIVIFIILETIVMFFLIARVLDIFGINVFNAGTKIENQAASRSNNVQRFSEEIENGERENNLRIGKFESPKQIENVAGSTAPIENQITISDMTVSLSTETAEATKIEVIKENGVKDDIIFQQIDEIKCEIKEELADEDAYVPPKLSNFKNEDMSVQKLSESELYDNAKTIISVLSAIKIESKVTDVIIGTSIIRYEVAVKNSADIVRVERARKALLSRLQIDSLSIEAPILGKDRVGIALPNPFRQTVSIKRLLEDVKFQKAPSTTVVIGRDITGGAVLCDLAKMPHLLIAGSTGMGKSVCLNAIIVSLLFHAQPKDVKLILIDPKRVEFNMYQNIPHLLQDIVYEAEGALEVLNRAVEETEKRYNLFSQSNARDIDTYNLTAKTKLSKIIIIIDELAELMMSGDLKKEIEFQIQRLAQKARAAGVHLVVATQRPSVDVITGVIKSNLPSRIAFKLSNGVDSKTILDESGAEDLLGKGEMFYKPSNFSEKLRVQGAYVTEEEIQAVVDEIKSRNLKLTVFEESTDVEIIEPTFEKENYETKIRGDVEVEELFAEGENYEAKVWGQIQDLKEITIGELQRICLISYSKAFELLELFEAQGLIEQVNDECYAVV